LNDDRREKHFGRGCKPRPAKGTPSGKNLNDDRREKHFGRGCKPRPAKSPAESPAEKTPSGKGNLCWRGLTIAGRGLQPRPKPLLAGIDDCRTGFATPSETFAGGD